MTEEEMPEKAPVDVPVSPPPTARPARRRHAAVQVQEPAAVLPEEETAQLDPMQKEFLDVINALLVAVHEVVYTANLLDDDVVESHPELKDHVAAVKKLGKIAWRFQKLARRVASRGQAR